MKQRNLLIATGVGCFLAFVVATVPARIMADLVPADVATLSDTSGTLWNGSAQAVTVGGLQLTEVNWDLHVLSLLLGRLSLTLDAKWADGFVQGDAAVGLTGSIRLRDVRLTGPLAPITQQMNLGNSGGELAVDIVALDIVDEWPTQIVGDVRVGRVPLNMIGVAGGVSGNYQLEFDVEDVPEGGAIPGVVKDAGGPLEILGELRLTPPRNYNIQARIKARPEAPPDLATGLSLVGPKLPDGSHEFQMSGSL